MVKGRLGFGEEGGRYGLSGEAYSSGKVSVSRADMVVDRPSLDPAAFLALVSGLAASSGELCGCE